MASRSNPGGDLKLISELHNFEVESGEPDPRGWPVVDARGGRLGTVRDLAVDTSAMKVRQLIVDLDTTAGSGGRRVLIDVAEVDVRKNGKQVVAQNISSAREYDAAAFVSHGSRSEVEDQHIVTRAEEELKVRTREVSRGTARVSKHVETEHVSTPVTRSREELVVERRPVDEVRADASIGEDDIRIPLTQEEVVVEKRPVVKEELVIGKRTVKERDTVEADVRREEFDIDTDSTQAKKRERG
jgi:uncharacterized protein (TIGR02271 family)